MPEKLSEGICQCIVEPQGQHGMEGFVCGEKYKFSVMKDSKGKYCRVYHSETYYETCGMLTFKKFFKGTS